MKTQLRDIMLDFETMATSQDTKILSVGLVKFNLQTGEIGKDLYCRFDINRGANRFRYEDHAPGGTMEWWGRQDAGVRKEAFSGQMNINHFVTKLLPEFLPPGARMYGNGANFDVAILDNLHAQLRLPTPYKFWNVLDVRTFVEIGKGIEEKGRLPEGIAHHPIYDCKFQIEYVCRIYKILRDEK